jgi:hypothetical protein
MSSSDIANRIGLKPLATHRKYNDIVFMYKLFNGMIGCPELLSLISFKVPTFNTRNILSFHFPQLLEIMLLIVQYPACLNHVMKLSILILILINCIS